MSTAGRKSTRARSQTPLLATKAVSLVTETKTGTASAHLGANTKVVFDARSMEQFMVDSYAHQIACKMFHFQTRRGFHHTAVDTYSKVWAISFDTFMEDAQAIFGRVETKEVSIKVISTPTPAAMVAEMRIYAASLAAFVFSDTQSALATTRDQILIDLFRFIYLLSFE